VDLLASGDRHTETIKNSKRKRRYSSDAHISTADGNLLLDGQLAGHGSIAAGDVGIAPRRN
jgi:hypothetical protein